MSSLQEDLAQVLWQEYVVNTGRALPEGLADKLAQAAVTHCMTAETRTLTNGWVQPLYAAPYIAAGLPVPKPEIREQQRWVTGWEDIA